MMKLFLKFIGGLLAVLLFAAFAPCAPLPDSPPVLRTAKTVPVKYYLSLPNGWNADVTWPILVTIDGSGHNFLANCQTFIRVRGNRPFIIVTPCVTSNGKDPADAQAVLAIVQEVQEVQGECRRQAKFFLTGFSAGGHVAWQIIFAHPELLAGAAPAAANFVGRGITTVSDAAERSQIPIHAFQGDKDPHLAALNQQWNRALGLARNRGYQNITRTMVLGAGHAPLAEAVIDFCSAVLSKSTAP